MPNEHQLTLREVEQARGDLYAIAADLDRQQPEKRAA